MPGELLVDLQLPVTKGEVLIQAHGKSVILREHIRVFLQLLGVVAVLRGGTQVGLEFVDFLEGGRDGDLKVCTVVILKELL